MAKARNTEEILLQQTRDKSVELKGDVILDDANIAITAAQTTISATQNTTSASQNTISAAQNTTSATKATAIAATAETSLDRSIGRKGCEMRTSASDALEEIEADTYYAIQMINDTTFDLLTGLNCTGTFTGIVYPAGSVIYLNVSMFSISVGGPAILYKAQA